MSASLVVLYAMAWLMGFCCGVSLCALAGTLPDWRGLLLLAALLLLWRRFLPHYLLSSWSFVAMLLLGLAYAAWCAERQLVHSLLPEWELRPVRLVIRLQGLPAKRGKGTRFLAQVEQVQTTGARVPALVWLSSIQARYWTGGSRWRVTVKLRTRHATANPYGFDVEQWMWGHGVLASGSVVGRPEQLDDATDLLARIDRLRWKIAARVQQVLGPSRAAALITALTVGDQQGISRQDWRLFSQTGVTHLVSISGLHIGMVAGMAGMLARRILQRSPSARWPLRLLVSLCALAAAGGYALLAGWSVPTRRTFFMLAVAGCLLWSRRTLSPFHIWWLALSVLLLFDPFAVFLPGLWLSFGLVAALMLTVSGRSRIPSKWRVWLAGQWASSVMSIVPLTVFFATLPLVSPLANLLAIPWISILLAPLSLLAVAVPLDGLLHLTSWLASGFFSWLELLGNVPVLSLPGMPSAVLSLALLGSLWLIAPLGMPGRGLALLLLLPLFFYPAPRPQPGHVWISVLDVGQGTSILVRTARHALLYDTGALAAEQVVLPQLAGMGVRSLDMLVLSHHDNDHDGAALDLLRALPVKTLRVGQMSSTPAGYVSRRCQPGQSWDWDEIRFEVFAPLPQITMTGNNAQSCVLRIASRLFSLLLAGDIPQAVESQLVDRYGSRLASTVLLAPHHGSKTSSSMRFLRTVAPRWAVVSAGFRNRYGHPHAVVLAQYRAQGSEVLRTDGQGALDIRFEHQVSITAYRQAHRRYWRP